MKKYLIGALALMALIASVLFYISRVEKSAFKAGENSEANKCKTETIIQVKEVIKIQNATEKTIIKSKKIAETNRFLDRNELIDKL